MKIERDHRDAQWDADAAVDERIRRRFRRCETLPLFAENPGALPLPDFFQPPHTGQQLRLDLRPAGQYPRC